MSKLNMIIIVSVSSVLLVVICLYAFYYNRWKHLWALETNIASHYKIRPNKDSSLTVAMIGDSWAELHHEQNMDTYFSSILKQKIGRPVHVESKGKGGEKTRGIYKLMFDTDEFGTKPLLSLKPDYCIISAGINDAAANLGTKQYCYYYRQILDFLLANHIVGNRLKI